MSAWLAANRRLAIFGALVALQVVAVVAFIGREELFLRTGTEILVESRPVDPRDPLRGDFIILSYAFENLDGRTIEGVWCCGQGSNAYIWMREQGAYWEPFRVTSNRPSRDELDERDAVAIRGRVDFGSSERMRVSFTNIGQFFVPQGDGNPPAPPDVRLVIDGDGSARVRGLQIDGVAWP